MKTVFLIFAFAFLGLQTAAHACYNCSYRESYQQLCVSEFIQNGYTNPDAFYAICAPIRTRAAYRCMQGLISHGYSNLNSEFGSACAVATDCGVEALNALFENDYEHIPSSFVAEVAQARNSGLANCYAQVFNAHYSNLTSYNIHEICGY